LKARLTPVLPSPLLHNAEFVALQRLFKAAAGLSFDASAQPVFQQRLASRLPLHDLTNFRDYLRVLESGPESHEEMAAALELVTAGETYFFRHEEQLRLFSETILPTIAEANAMRRRLSIWSAGCSSGEEAYTAAILVQESGLFDGWQVRIMGSDLSHERIEHARQGCYFQGAFRTTRDDIRQRYFIPQGVETGAASAQGGTPVRHKRFWQVQEQTRQLCQFAVLNLFQLGRWSSPPELEVDMLSRRADVILCRNVLLYLDERARVRVLRNLYEHLAPGGFLLLGHSESLKNVEAPLDLVSLQQELAFRRPSRMRRGALP
jgi:chemotaxis protein methyltransferase CheR